MTITREGSIKLEQKDAFGDRLQVEKYGKGGFIYLTTMHGDGTSSVAFELTPKKARKLVKTLQKLAKA